MCRHSQGTNFDRLFAEIDELVYELFGLTPEEIAIVEDAAVDMFEPYWNTSAISVISRANRRRGRQPK